MASAQSIVDSCFTSTAYGTGFGSSSILNNVYDSDLLEWTGSGWVGGWSQANLTIPPPTNTPGCRAIFIGNSVTWTTGGESFGLKLSAPLVAGQTYTFNITYVSHGFGSNGAFNPNVYTNSTPSIGYLVGSLPPVGNAWTTQTYIFTAVPAQNGHTWLILSTSPNGSSGLVNSFCKTCNAGVTCNVNLGNDTALCNGATYVLNATTTNAVYQWQDNSTAPTYTVGTAGTYWVKVTVNGCTATDTIHVAYNAPPFVDLGKDTILCPGQHVVLNATTANATYQWQNNSGSATYTVTQQGTYWVNVTSNNCSTSDTVVVASHALQVLSLGPDTSLCSGKIVVLHANIPATTYLWQDGSIAATDTISQSGTYWLHVSDTLCTTGDTISVIFNAPPVVNLGTDTSLCLWQTLVLNASTTGATYQWQDNSAAPIYPVSQQGIYWVVVHVKDCSASDTIEVLAKNCVVDFEMPNIFSPNQDGINEYFQPSRMLGILNVRFSVFNRWGQKVFESEGSNGWDGKFKGNNCAEGTYYWMASYTTDLGDAKNVKGFLTLVR